MDSSNHLIEQAERAERLLATSESANDRDALEALAAQLRERAAILDANLTLARAH